MPVDEEPPVSDFRLFYEATTSLLGYFVHTWYAHYLTLIAGNLKRWYEQGLIVNLAEPTSLGTYSMLFDFEALDLEKATYINGIYFYILASHKAANHDLMHRFEGKQVLYLRGYDFEGSVAAGGGIAMGFSSIDTARFGWKLGDRLAQQFRVFKVLGAKDVYWETADAQRHFSDFPELSRFARRPIRSIFMNARHWKKDVANILDRMDHYLVYVSSLTDSVLWELAQLDTDDRRGRVTVVFDEEAIENKEAQLSMRDKMRAEYGAKLIWSKKGRPPAKNAAELSEQLSRTFLLTAPCAFEKDFEAHCRRIAGDSARLPPGARETWLDFRFHPALAEDKLNELRDISAWVEAWIAARAGERGIDCLPLFLNQVQLRIFLTLLIGEHDETGRALAAYAAVMQGALDYYGRPGDKGGDLSEGGRERHLDMLRDHLEMARHIAFYMLAIGKSHEFDDFRDKASAVFAEEFDRTKPAVAKFFEIAAARHARQERGAAPPS